MPTTAEVNQAAADFIADTATADAKINGAAGTVTDRHGTVTKNLQQIFQDIGYQVPVAFASGLTPNDGSFTVSYNGEVYAADPAALPFTTTSTFDPSQWLKVQPYKEYDTVTDLLASTESARGVGIIWEAGGFRYQEADGAATDHHLTTAGGVKLYVKLPFYSGAFGAKADWDGSSGADDTAAIQTMLDAMATAANFLSRKECYLSPGRHKADGLTLPAGVYLDGLGRSASIEATTSSNLITQTGNDAGIVGIVLVGKNLAGASGSEANGFFVSGSVQGITVKDCEFQNFGNATTPGAGAIRIEGTCSRITIEDNLVTGGIGEGVASDINLYSAQIGDAIITGNRCLSANRQGIAVQMGSGAATGKHIVSSNICDGHTEWGILLAYGDADTKYCDIVCDGNVCRNNKGGGVYFATGSVGGGSVIISNNVVSFCGGRGSNGTGLTGGIVTSGAFPVLVTGNIVSWTGYDESFTAGATLADAVICTGTHQVVKSNVIERATRYGAFGSSSNKTIIWEDNTFVGCSLNISPGTIVYDLVRIVGNTVDNSSTDADGIVLQPGDATSYNNSVISGNTLIGSKAGTGKRGLYVHSARGECVANTFKNWDTAHELYDYVATEAWGDNVNWAHCTYIDNTIAIKGDGGGGGTRRPVVLFGHKFDGNTTDISATNNSFYTGPAPFQTGYPRRVFATAAPTQWSWAVGDEVINSNPAVGSPKGWVCTAAGVPGTWVSTGTL